MRRRIACLLAPLVACAPRGALPSGRFDAGAGAPAAHLLAAESPQALLAWTRADPSAREQGGGMLERAVFGQKVFVRAVLTGVAEGAQPRVEGRLTLRDPGGQQQHVEALSAEPVAADPLAPGVLVLAPGLDLIFDPGDATGTWRIAADLSCDGAPLELARSLQVESGGDFGATGGS